MKEVVFSSATFPGYLISTYNESVGLIVQRKQQLNPDEMGVCKEMRVFTLGASWQHTYLPNFLSVAA